MKELGIRASLYLTIFFLCIIIASAMLFGILLGTNLFFSFLLWESTLHLVLTWGIFRLCIAVSVLTGLWLVFSDLGREIVDDWERKMYFRNKFEEDCEILPKDGEKE